MNTIDRFIILVLTIFTILLWCLGPTFTYDDSGEYSVSSMNYGIAHPPGYPVYITLGRLFTLIPFGGIGWRMNFMSLFFLCMATAVAGEIIWRHSGSRLLWISTGLLIAGMNRLVSQALIAEVHTLNLFLMLITAFFVLESISANTSDKCISRKSLGNLCAAGITAGISIGCHHIAMLGIPAMLAMVIYAFRKIPVRKWLLPLIASFLAGALVLAIPPLRSMHDPVMDWGNAENLTSYWQSLTRYQYIESEKNPFEPLESLKLLLYWPKVFIRENGAVTLSIILAMSVFIAVCAFKSKAVGKTGNLSLTGNNWFLPVLSAFMALLTGPFFILLLNFRETPKLDYYNSIFLIPSMTFAIIMIMSLIGTAIKKFSAQLIRDNWSETSLLRTRILCAVILLTLFGRFTKTAVREDLSEYYLYYDYLMSAMEKIPRNSVLIVEGDPYTFGLWYIQEAMNRRRDIIVLNTQMLALPWYSASFMDSRIALPSMGISGMFKAKEISRLRLNHLAQNLAGSGRLISLFHVEALMNSGYEFIPQGFFYTIQPPNSKIMIKSNCSDRTSAECIASLDKNFRLRGVDKFWNFDFGSEDCIRNCHITLFNNGVFWQNREDPDFIDWFKAAARIYPGGIESREVLGNYAYSRGFYDEAAKFYGEAFNLGSANSIMKCRLARVLHLKGKVAKARKLIANIKLESLSPEYKAEVRSVLQMINLENSF
ncbi:MAG: hypothetical protein CVV64_08045 [Candidatus Wallbacteria bacterium HGW-Wallbacteria-1]|jgi:hypothetical protein|uniref:DUF2723 domain-containing protein n=1 Tax=Candidatus Wallbacteria bacterium HGW-Wallbacteria-1 TaxID=2013854 RepID=A0A2N1PR49_9BACT|nr:MAG: hypothetical protein CVV64_08045 [Candidatus Wallbacteria bacterium HGW-Wallbacteria-1]